MVSRTLMFGGNFFKYVAPDDADSGSGEILDFYEECFFCDMCPTVHLQEGTE